MDKEFKNFMEEMTGVYNDVEQEYDNNFLDMQKNEKLKELAKEFFKEIRERYGDENVSNEQIKKDITADYSDLIDLRNRIKNGTDEDTTLYEEDSITLDHILDYIELFMKLINIGDLKNE